MGTLGLLLGPLRLLLTWRCLVEWLEGRLGRRGSVNRGWAHVVDCSLETSLPSPKEGLRNRGHNLSGRGRFHAVFGPQFMTALEAGSGVSSSVLPVSRGFVFAVKRWWLSKFSMRTSSSSSGLRKVIVRAVVEKSGEPLSINVTRVGCSILLKKKAVSPFINLISCGLIRTEVPCIFRRPLSRMAMMI